MLRGHLDVAVAWPEHVRHVAFRGHLDMVEPGRFLSRQFPRFLRRAVLMHKLARVAVHLPTNLLKDTLGGHLGGFEDLSLGLHDELLDIIPREELGGRHIGRALGIPRGPSGTSAVVVDHVLRDESLVAGKGGRPDRARSPLCLRSLCAGGAHYLHVVHSTKEPSAVILAVLRISASASTTSFWTSSLARNWEPGPSPPRGDKRTGLVCDGRPL